MTQTSLTPLPLQQWLSAQRADSTLIAWRDQQNLTLAHLRADVVALMGQLAQYPVKRWALCFEDSYLFIVGLLALLHSGKTPVIPGHCRIAQLNEQQHLFDGILAEKSFTCRHLVLPLYPTGERLCATPALNLSPVPPESHVELFTSGSTGQPRQIIKPISCLDREVQLLAVHFSAKLQGCRIIASVVPQHQYGLTFRVMLPVALGIPLHASMLLYPEQLTALDQRYRYAFISSPAFLKRLDYQLQLPAIDFILSAAGQLPWQHVVNIKAQLGITVDEIYGSTETGVLAWRYREQDHQPWRTFPGVRLQRQPLGVQVTSSLIPQPEGLLLDDELIFDQQGNFQLNGRCGRVVKIEEKRVSLIEVERRLLELDDVCDAAALLISRAGRQSIAALLVLTGEAYRLWQHNNHKQQEFTWRRKLLPWLESVAIPRYWRVVPSIPVNSMSKRVDAQLQELFRESP